MRNVKNTLRGGDRHIVAALFRRFCSQHLFQLGEIDMMQAGSTYDLLGQLVILLPFDAKPNVKHHLVQLAQHCWKHFTRQVAEDMRVDVNLEIRLVRVHAVLRSGQHGGAVPTVEDASFR